MERLTIHDGMYKRLDPEQVEAIYKKLRAYEDTGLEPEQCAKYAQAEKEGRYIVLKEPRSAGVHRLEEIARADIEGRLAVLPCKESPVWIVEEATHDCDTVPDKDCMSRPDCEGCPALKSYVRRLDEFYYTRAEAETAMKGDHSDE